jgi:hypothetical protein
MEILGLMEILAISKLIGDTDCLGGDLTNVGFKVVSDSQVMAVKVDMGCSFNESFDTNQLKALELYLMELELTNYRKLQTDQSENIEDDEQKEIFKKKGL